MSGNRTSRSSSSSSSTSNEQSSGQTSSGLGSTPTAIGGLPGFQEAFDRSRNVDPYTGPVAADFDYDGPVTPIQGDVSGFVAQGTPMERQGISQAAQGIQGLAPQTGGTATNLSNYWNDITAAGPAGILESDPYNALINQVRSGSQELLDYNNAAIANQFAGSGGWAGTEQARAAAFSAEEVGENLARQESELGYNAFLFGHDLMGRAAGGANDALSLSAAPGTAMMNLGGAERGLNQLGLDEELAQTNWLFDQENQQIQNDLFQAGVQQANEQAGIANAMAENEALRNADMELYSRFFDTLNSGAFGQDTSVSTSSTGTSRGTQSGTQSGGGSGADTASAVGSLASAAIMAMAMWSDGRLKENIRPVKRHKGLTWYGFNFTKAAQEALGLPSVRQIGVIAQEVLLSPLKDAVYSGPGGILLVDYQKVI